MNKFLALIITLSFLTSCDDFTQKNLDVAEGPEELSNVDLLLSEADNINNGEFSLEKLIANTGSFVTAPIVEKIKTEAKELDSSIAQFCQTLEAFPTLDASQLNTLRTPIQESWKNVMATYHQLAMMNFGPMAFSTSTAMDSIYSFDGQEKCKLDASLMQNDLLISRNRDPRYPRFDTISNYNIRGLDTIEAMFFADATKSRCKKPNDRIAAWYQKPLLEREKQVCGFAKHIMGDVLVKTEELQKAWSPLQGYFTATMLRAETPLTYTNQISQALFFLDTNTKDIKLSYPAGFEVRVGTSNTKCPDASCPGSREHPYAEFSLEAIENSLIGFKKLFTGQGEISGLNGYGFDDLLISEDAAELSKTMMTNLDTVIKNIQEFKKNNNFKDALTNIDQTKCENTTATNRLEEVCALVWDIRTVTDLLKVDYLSALQSLSAPSSASGDND